MPTLTIQLPGRRPVEHAWRTGTITLGRAAENTVALDDASVSQSHARITHAGNDYFLQDLHSTNGTKLNGRTISEACLYDGDEVKLGDVALTFRLFPANGVELANAPATSQINATTTILPAKRDTALLKPVERAPNPAPVRPQASPNKKSSTTLITAAIGMLVALGFAAVLIWKPAEPTVTSSNDVTPPVHQVQPAPAPTTTPAPTNAVTEAATTPPAIEAPPTNPPPVAITNAPEVLRTTNDLPELLIVLRSRDVEARRRAAQSISEMGSGAENVLLNLRVALLQDSDVEVRFWLVVALASNQTYDQAGVSVLVETLRSENSALRQKACTMLAALPLDESNKATVVAALNGALNDGSEDVRNAAQVALKRIAPEAAADK